MKQLATILAILALALTAFGQENELWDADDPRTANPLNLYELDNPLNPVNEFRLDNDLNPVNRFKSDNPLNPVNKYRLDNMLNPVNRFHPDSPLNPINQYRSPSNPPTEGMFNQYESYTYAVPQYELQSDPADSLLDDLLEDDPY